jgi:predicted nucleic acid-binding protein
LKSYWDTSAVINAAISADVFARLSTGEHVTRLHTFAEFFATLTGRGTPIPVEGQTARFKLSGNECATWLRQFAAKVTIVELDQAEVLDALTKAQRRNVQGGRVYDYLHATACRKAKADELLTRNTDDFQGLVDHPAWP